MKPTRLNPIAVAAALAMAAGVHPQALAYLMPAALRSKPNKKDKVFTPNDQEALDRAEAKRLRKQQRRVL